MNPTAQAALDRARRPPPAPVFSTETAPKPDKPLPMPVATGHINHFMRLQARSEAIDLACSLKVTYDNGKGLAQVINALKRAAIGRPGSVVRGFLDIIEQLEKGNGQ